MSRTKEFEISVLAGDGIGPEVSEATVEVLAEAA
jgi:isocitrate/isopropylmalate dehydrogenase